MVDFYIRYNTLDEQIKQLEIKWFKRKLKEINIDTEPYTF